MILRRFVLSVCIVLAWGNCAPSKSAVFNEDREPTAEAAAPLLAEPAGAAGSGAVCSGAECDCYSPTKNLSGSHDKKAKGCECKPEGRNVCIDGYSLYCMNGAWITALDGACSRSDKCARIEDSVDACVSKHGSCAKQSDGRFCARDSD